MRSAQKKPDLQSVIFFVFDFFKCQTWNSQVIAHFKMKTQYCLEDHVHCNALLTPPQGSSWSTLINQRSYDVGHDILLVYSCNGVLTANEVLSSLEQKWEDIKSHHLKLSGHPPLTFDYGTVFTEIWKENENYLDETKLRLILFLHMWLNSRTMSSHSISDN